MVLFVDQQTIEAAACRPAGVPTQPAGMAACQILGEPDTLTRGRTSSAKAKAIRGGNCL